MKQGGTTSTISLNKALVIETAQRFGLSGLRTVLTLAAAIYETATCTSLTKMAIMARMDRHIFKRYMDRLVAAGFVKESRNTRNRCWRSVVQIEGSAVEIDRAIVSEYPSDTTALAMLIQALANANSEVVIDFDSLAELAGRSRDTADRHFKKLQELGWVTRKRVSRSEYLVRLSVPAGTSAKSTHVRCADTLRELNAKAMASLRCRPEQGNSRRSVL
jgi:DNA-binding MarR family transcriptional regulator